MQALRLSGSNLNVAFQKWGAGNPKKVLCLHGWLDNSNSFSYLGPYLAKHGNFEVVAVDHVGHGKSEHFQQLTSYAVFAGCLKGIQDALGWETSHIVGHSMGANMGLLYAGSFPERVEKLALIEGIGPPTEKAEDAAKLFRQAVLAEDAAAKKFEQFRNKRKAYDSIEEAIKSRVEVVKSYPGKQTISPEGAAAIVSRGTARVAADSEDPVHLDPSRAELYGPVTFQHDYKLVLPTLVHYTEDEVMSFVRGVRSQTLFVSAEKGWPLKRVLERKQGFQKGLLMESHLPGSHHLHLDPADAPQCADVVTSFLLGTHTV